MREACRRPCRTSASVMSSARAAPAQASDSATRRSFFIGASPGSTVAAEDPRAAVGGNQQHVSRHPLRPPYSGAVHAGRADRHARHRGPRAWVVSRSRRLMSLARHMPFSRIAADHRGVAGPAPAQMPRRWRIGVCRSRAVKSGNPLATGGLIRIAAAAAGSGLSDLAAAVRLLVATCAARPGEVGPSRRAGTDELAALAWWCSSHRLPLWGQGSPGCPTIPASVMAGDQTGELELACTVEGQTISPLVPGTALSCM